MISFALSQFDDFHFCWRWTRLVHCCSFLPDNPFVPFSGYTKNISFCFKWRTRTEIKRVGAFEHFVFALSSCISVDFGMHATNGLRWFGQIKWRIMLHSFPEFNLQVSLLLVSPTWLFSYVFTSTKVATTSAYDSHFPCYPLHSFAFRVRWSAFFFLFLYFTVRFPFAPGSDRSALTIAFFLTHQHISRFNAFIGKRCVFACDFRFHSKTLDPPDLSVCLTERAFCSYFTTNCSPPFVLHLVSQLSGSQCGPSTYLDGLSYFCFCDGAAHAISGFESFSSSSSFPSLCLPLHTWPSTRDQTSRCTSPSPNLHSFVTRSF